jgi:hypothetical protein
MLYDSEDRMQANMAGSQEAYAEAREPAARASEAFPHIAKLLTANGHSPYKAAEIIQVAQQSWSKNFS